MSLKLHTRCTLCVLGRNPVNFASVLKSGMFKLERNLVSTGCVPSESRREKGRDVKQKRNIDHCRASPAAGEILTRFH